MSEYWIEKLDDGTNQEVVLCLDEDGIVIGPIFLDKTIVGYNSVAVTQVLQRRWGLTISDVVSERNNRVAARDTSNASREARRQQRLSKLRNFVAKDHATLNETGRILQILIQHVILD